METIESSLVRRVSHGDGLIVVIDYSPVNVLGVDVQRGSIGANEVSAKSLSAAMRGVTYGDRLDVAVP